MERVTIKEVRAYVQSGSDGAADYHDQERGHWIIDTPIANPCSVWDKYKHSRLSWGINALGSFVVEVELSNGITGFGTSIGGPPACFLVEKHLNRFVEGADVRDIELMWEQMWRASMPYGRKGVTIQAISAIDLALWDCLGKLRNEPVYALLGGKTKKRLPVYATTARPDLAKEMGFVGAKFPLKYGPSDGDEGFRKNLEHIAEMRASVGPDFPLMIDCYMSLTVHYAIKLGNAVSQAPYNIKWIEEVLPPDDHDGYAEVKRVLAPTGIMITTGEHEYTRYGFRELISRKCCDVLQPDINWVGGLTEARRIVAMAAAYDLRVIPHGSSVFSYHMQYAFNQCPIAEYLVMSPNADTIVPLFGDLMIGEPLPKDGWIELTDKPGWGVELNKTNLVRPYDHVPFEGFVAPSDKEDPLHIPF